MECAGTPPVATTHERAGVTLAAYDGTGALWAATREALFRLENGAWEEKGRFATSAKRTGQRCCVLSISETPHSYGRDFASFGRAGESDPEMATMTATIAAARQI